MAQGGAGVEYVEGDATITADQLRGGFFEGWPQPPSPEVHLAHMRGAEASILAIDPKTGQVVGFVSAVGDGVLTAFVPLLEVLPGYRGRGIGTELMRRMLARLSDRYAVDLVCDPEVAPFYRGLGGTTSTAVMWRNREALVPRPR